MLQDWDANKSIINRNSHKQAVLLAKRPKNITREDKDLFARKYTENDLITLEDRLLNRDTSYSYRWPAVQPIQEHRVSKYLRGAKPEEIYYDVLLPVLDQYNLGIAGGCLCIPVYDLADYARYTNKPVPEDYGHYHIKCLTLTWISDLVRKNVWCPFIPEELDTVLRKLESTKWWYNRYHISYEPKLLEPVVSPATPNVLIHIPDFMIDLAKVRGCLFCAYARQGKPPSSISLICGPTCNSAKSSVNGYLNLIYNPVDVIKDIYLP